ncbi:MAG: autotransporter outer membrane beta-barrel domain-containing protein, partial [Pseudomonadota bacterium]
SSLLLTSMPGASRRIDRLTKQAAPNSTRVAGRTVPGMSGLGLSADLAAETGSVSTSLLGWRPNKVDDGKFDVWAGASWQDYAIAGNEGAFSVVYAGADYLVSDRLLVGAMIQHDRVEQEGEGRDGVGEGSGRGFLVGPYATVRLSERLFADGLVAVGQSSNDLKAVAGGVQDFSTDRFLARFSLTGDFDLGANTTLRPTVEVRHLTDEQQGYTNDLGVSIDATSVDLTEIVFSPRLESSWKLSKNSLARPYAELSGIFGSGTAADVIDAQSRARIEVGSSFSSDHGLGATVSSFVDGLGTEDFEVYGLRFQVSYQF